MSGCNSIRQLTLRGGSCAKGKGLGLGIRMSGASASHAIQLICASIPLWLSGGEARTDLPRVAKFSKLKI